MTDKKTPAKTDHKVLNADLNQPVSLKTQQLLDRSERLLNVHAQALQMLDDKQ